MGVGPQFESSRDPEAEKITEEMQRPADVIQAALAILPDEVDPRKALIIREPIPIPELAQPLENPNRYPDETLDSLAQTAYRLLQERTTRRAAGIDSRQERPLTYSSQEEKTMDIWMNQIGVNLTQLSGVVLAGDVVKQTMLTIEQRPQIPGSKGNLTAKTRLDEQTAIEKALPQKLANDSLALAVRFDRHKQEEWVKGSLETLAVVRTTLARLLKTQEGQVSQSGILMDEELQNHVLEQFDLLVTEALLEGVMKDVRVTKPLGAASMSTSNLEGDPLANLVITANLVGRSENEFQRQAGKHEKPAAGGIVQEKKATGDLRSMFGQTIRALAEYNRSSPFEPTPIDVRAVKIMAIILDDELPLDKRQEEIKKYVAGLVATGDLPEVGPARNNVPGIYMGSTRPDSLLDRKTGKLKWEQVRGIPEKTVNDLIVANRETVPREFNITPALLEEIKTGETNIPEVRLPQAAREKLEVAVLDFIMENIPPGTAWHNAVNHELADNKRREAFGDRIRDFVGTPQARLVHNLVQFVGREYERAVDYSQGSLPPTSPEVNTEIAAIQIGRAFMEREFGPGNRYSLPPWKTHCDRAPANTPYGIAGDPDSRINEASERLDRAMAVAFLKKADPEGVIIDTKTAASALFISYSEMVRSIIHKKYPQESEQ